jgi:hypothetical protein
MGAMADMARIQLLIFRPLKIAFILLISVVSAPISSESWAQTNRIKDTTCGVTPSRTMFRNFKRDEVALFFQNHIPKKPLNLVDFLTSFKTKATRSSEVKEALDMNFISQRALAEITNTIGDLFIQKKVSWMGIEKEADEVGIENEEELYRAASEVESQLKKDRMKAGDIKAFLVLQMGPILYSRWKNEALRKSARLVPLDDLSIRMRVNAYTDKLQERSEFLLKSVAHSGLRTSEMERIIEICQIDLFAGEKDRSAEFQALVAKLKKSEVKKVVEDYRTWIEQGVESFRERDRHVSNQILAQRGHGMVHVSRSLGPGVTDHLVESCVTSSSKKK